MTAPDLPATPSPPRARRITPEILVGTAAVLLSLAALVVSVVQTRILSAQQRAAVWPRLQIGPSHLDADFSVTLVNAGIGPAVIHETAFEIHGRTYPSMWGLARAEVLNAFGDSLAGTGTFYESLGSGSVVRPGQEVEVLLTRRNATLAHRLDSLVSDSSFHAQIVYADVYGACWRLDNDTVRTLSACDDGK